MFGDVLSSKSQQQMANTQLLIEQPLLLTTFTGTLFGNGWTHGTRPYTNITVPRDKMILGGVLHFANYIITNYRTAFENLLRISLEIGDLNSDESVVALMCVRFPYLVNAVGPLPFGQIKENRLERSSFAQVSSFRRHYSVILGQPPPTDNRTESEKGETTNNEGRQGQQNE